MALVCRASRDGEGGDGSGREQAQREGLAGLGIPALTRRNKLKKAVSCRCPQLAGDGAGGSAQSPAPEPFTVPTSPGDPSTLWTVVPHL